MTRSGLVRSEASHGNGLKFPSTSSILVVLALAPGASNAHRRYLLIQWHLRKFSRLAAFSVDNSAPPLSQLCQIVPNYTELQSVPATLHASKAARLAGEAELPADTLSLWISGLSTLIAALAFARPEIDSLVKRWICQIDFFPHNRVEVGFSSFGPTIGVNGTMRAIRGDQFVRELSLSLTRTRDQKKHNFSWGLSRNRQIVVGSGAGETMNAELCSGFTVSREGARTVDTLYMDMDTRDRYISNLTEWQNAWNNARLDDPEIQQLLLGNQLLQAVNIFSAKHRELLHHVTKAVEREFYWETSEYNLVLYITTSRPEKHFIFYGIFELSEAEVAKLHGNISKMLIELCDV